MMTNADRIRNMTDEELAMFFVSKDVMACTHCTYHHEAFRCTLYQNCSREHAMCVLIDWLFSPAVVEPEQHSYGDNEN